MRPIKRTDLFMHVITNQNSVLLSRRGIHSPPPGSPLGIISGLVSGLVPKNVIDVVQADLNDSYGPGLWGLSRPNSRPHRFSNEVPEAF